MADNLGPFRPLHWVLRVSDRAANMRFLCDTLGMRVLRHEEFEAGCEAQCNGPYDGRWSKTMVGYAAESESFALEITYNYTQKTAYEKGNDLVHIDVRVLPEVARNAGVVAGAADLKSPEGYVFRVAVADGAPRVACVRVRALDAHGTARFYHSVLGMRHVDKTVAEVDVAVCYDATLPFKLEFVRLGKRVDHAAAGGRLAVAVGDPAPFEKVVGAAGGAVHTPLVVLHTPGKTSVSVVILSDPDGSEVCVVNDDGFADLSRVDEEAHAALWKAIEEDKSR